MDAISKLKAAIDAALSVNVEPPPIPPLLLEEIESLERALRGAGADRPPRDRIREAILLFRQSDELPNLSVARAVCFGAAERFGVSEPALIEEAGRFPRLLDIVDDYRPEPRGFRRCYRGLVHTYLAYDGEHSNTSKEGRHNWHRLRDYLHDRRGAIVADGTQPEWVQCITQHANLLTSDPASRYAADLLQGKNAVVEEIRSRLDVSDQHWLMRRLILAQIETATRESDASFVKLVRTLLGLLDGHEGLEDQGLSLILNRYASIQKPTLHAGLRDRAVQTWGNPWVKRHAPAWARVSEAARALVTSWFKLHVIRTFFELLSDDKQTDPRRVKFWEQFHEQIDDMYFALGATKMNSSNSDVKQMRKEMGDRLLGLRDAGARSNNAFIMMMGDVVAVEFGVTGHACFFYKRDSLPFDLRGDVSGSTADDGLRSPNNLERLTHVDTRFGRWEENFADALRRHGARRPSQTRVDHAPRRTTSASSDPPLDRQSLREFCESNAIGWRDKSADGGNISVYFSYNVGAFADRLKAWGFTFSERRGFWWRKQWP